MRIQSTLGCLILVAVPFGSSHAAESWTRHTIDDSSRGADGVRLADVNGDGLLDIATGWEEGGTVRVYCNPGPAHVRKTWPAVTVGQVSSPEDAVLADLDGDGAVDVVSCCEGRNRTIYAHWAPRAPDEYLDPTAWVTQPIPATQGKQSWMFALPMDVDGQYGIDFAVGSKGENATVGLLIAPESPRELDQWRFRDIYNAGWIMSLRALDMDRDGDEDIVVSDRRGERAGVLWLENPGLKRAAAGADWKAHRIVLHKSVMFLTIEDLDDNNEFDIVVSSRQGHILHLQRDGAGDWNQSRIQNPLGIPHGKSVTVGDIDLDGRKDIVHAANTQGDRSRPGVVWMKHEPSGGKSRWTVRDISGEEGIKFDLVEVLDLDHDEDLDVITCEERDNLGVIWYENPTR